MRSYDQYCSLARGLDVVGERWTLLVVRELLQGPRRYGELLDGLPGIATNLLTERLRSLESDGVVTRDERGRYALTRWGEGLSDAVYALGRWAGPLMKRPAGDAQFRGHWLHHMMAAQFDGIDPRRGDLIVELNIGDEPMTLISSGGRVRLVKDRTPSPDVTLTGPPDGVIGIALGRIDRREAVRLGVVIEGNARTLGRLRPMI